MVLSPEIALNGAALTSAGGLVLLHFSKAKLVFKNCADNICDFVAGK